MSDSISLVTDLQSEVSKSFQCRVRKGDGGGKTPFQLAASLKKELSCKRTRINHYNPAPLE